MAEGGTNLIRRRVETAVLYNRGLSEYIVPVANGRLLDESSVF